MLNSRSSIARAYRLYAIHGAKVNYTQCQCRFASLSSSIGRGIRGSRTANERSSRGYDQAPRWDDRSRGRDDANPPEKEQARQDNSRFSMNRGHERSKRDEEEGLRQSPLRRSNEDDGMSRRRYSFANHGPKPSLPREKERRDRKRNVIRNFQETESDGMQNEPIQECVARLQGELARLQKQMHAQEDPEWEGRKSHSKRQRFRDRDFTDVYYPLGDVKVVAPRNIVYSKIGTEFIYGSSAVLAALRCNRRKFYKLYIYQPDSAYNYSDDVERRASILKAIQKQGLVSGAKVIDVSGNWLRYLSKLSDQRPHNGVVLEASPLPQAPILALRPHKDPSDTHFGVQLAPQQQDEAEINGTNEHIARFFHTHDTDVLGSSTNKMERYPMVVVLDQIKDPGNLGAIIRSAYYFGVDAIILSRNCPKITPVVLKSSAGAAENIPIFRVTNTRAFIEASRENGWQFYAADAPEPESTSQDKNASIDEKSAALLPSAVGQKLYNAPSEDHASVDSLNVSVAAALLCQSFLGDSTIVQKAQPTHRPALTVPEMVNERMQDDRVYTPDEKEDNNRMF
ncbi:RNA methyltransferase [Ascosphaera apis ARSEF 7405]|uniref:rRNA methyltransferase 1, mitochondrial n=1 Tax=Ascosphaera apis ARSEF 7405 TaxID=392613 RepID=A0A167VIW0_9EURO|nr:RNA methyltransferase [Ascosphaera apis ARSEF 7405]